MGRKIGKILQEYIFGLSVICTIVGTIELVYSSFGILTPNVLMNNLGIKQGILNWSIYVLIGGFIVFIAGIWYLWIYLKNKRFLLKELEKNKRSEFLKLQTELEDAASHLPSKYKKLLTEKEESMRLK